MLDLKYLKKKFKLKNLRIIHYMYNIYDYNINNVISALSAFCLEYSNIFCIVPILVYVLPKQVHI